jgi:2-aminoadipate transaminase
MEEAMEMINFLRGVPSDEALRQISMHIKALFPLTINKYGTGVLQYTTQGLADFNGFIPLKSELAKRFEVPGDPSERIICTNGGMEMIAHFLNILTQRCIAVEASTYDRFLNLCKIQRRNTVGVKFSPEGISINDLDMTIEECGAVAFYQIIYHQNPTRKSPTKENVEEAAGICVKRGIPYICDIAYKDLRYDGERNFEIDLSLPCHANTCLVGSFTKTIAPGTKCGFGIFPKKYIGALSDLIANSRLNPNYPTQAFISEMMRTEGYDSYLKWLARHYEPRMRMMNQALKSMFAPTEYTPITGGFFTQIWLHGISFNKTFPMIARNNGVNIESGWNSMPGNIREIFENSGFPIRLTFPSLTPEAISEGISRLYNIYLEAKSMCN